MYISFQKLQLKSSSVYYNNTATLPLTGVSGNHLSNNSSNNHHHHTLQHNSSSLQKNLLYQSIDGTTISSIATTSKDFTLVTKTVAAQSSPSTGAATSLMSMSTSSHNNYNQPSSYITSGSSGTLGGGHKTIGGSDLDLNINAIKDRLMTTRVPESCV